MGLTAYLLALFAVTAGAATHETSWITGIDGQLEQLKVNCREANACKAVREGQTNGYIVSSAGFSGFLLVVANTTGEEWLRVSAGNESHAPSVEAFQPKDKIGVDLDNHDSAWHFDASRRPAEKGSDAMVEKPPVADRAVILVFPPFNSEKSDRVDLNAIRETLEVMDTVRVLAIFPTHAAISFSTPPFETVRDLAQLSFVHFIQPALSIRRTLNEESSSILQEGYTPSNANKLSRPLWEAGLRGQGQLVGCGDSGLDLNSCYFVDPTNNVPGPKHRKVHLYRRMFGDAKDENGHGTHVVGSIIGKASGPSSGTFSDYNGVAPEARVAFLDLGQGSSGALIAPQNLAEYYSLAYDSGVKVHSDSWGSGSLRYTFESHSLDAFTFKNQDFLPILAAGNFGTLGGYFETTVTSPATSKNAIAVGSTLGLDGPKPYTEGDAFDLKITAPAREANVLSAEPIRLLAATFGSNPDNFVGQQIQIAAVRPMNGCEDIKNNIEGKWAIVQRGECTFVEKIGALQKAGAAGVIVFNHFVGETDGTTGEELPSPQGYFKMAFASENSEDAKDITLPSFSLGATTGMLLYEIAENLEGSVLTGQLSRMAIPQGRRFENIAEFSSFGPTLDGRIKPDLVAPGENIESAAPVNGYGTTDISAKSSNPYGPRCATARRSGTSMSAPLVAGSALLVRQYFAEGWYPTGKATSSDRMKNPSGPLVKAALIASADTMSGFTEEGLPLDRSPSTRQGWGRVSLGLPISATNVSSQSPEMKDVKMYVQDRQPLDQGESRYYCLRAKRSSAQANPYSEASTLRVAITWYDPPASPAAGEKTLLNDIDLRLMSINGESLPYIFPAPNDVDNIERLKLQIPASGQEMVYGIAVKGTDMIWTEQTGDRQYYSIVALGPGLSADPINNLSQCVPGSKNGAQQSNYVDTSPKPLKNSDFGSKLSPSPTLIPNSDDNANNGDNAMLSDDYDDFSGDACGCSEKLGGCQKQLLATNGEPEYFCYVNDAKKCYIAVPSTSKEGLAWRQCKPED